MTPALVGDEADAEKMLNELVQASVSYINVGGDILKARYDIARKAVLAAMGVSK